MSRYVVKNILVPVDLSETSLNAVESAAAPAKKHGAALHLFYVAERGLVQSKAGTVPCSSAVNTEVLSAIASAIRHHHELSPAVVQVEGSVTECIVEAASHLPADLIVMGTRGASGVRAGFIGTNAYHTVKYSTSPVLTVPPGRKAMAFEKVLFPVRPVSGALKNYAAVDCFLASRAQVDVFCVSDRTDAGITLLNRLVDETKDQFRWAGIATRTFWGALSCAPDAILQHAVRTDPDLLVLTPVLDPVAKPDYVGPHAQKILHSAKVPILVVKKASVPSATPVAL